MSTSATAELLVGIGCEPEQGLPAEVLAYSINHSGKARIIKLHEIDGWDDQSASAKAQQRTPFSLQRFLLCQELLTSEADIGVYLDSDMLVMRPIEELVQAFLQQGKLIATAEVRPEWRRKRQSSVMLFDRKGAAQLLEAYHLFLDGKLTYDQLLYLETVGPIGTLPYSWNCLEFLDETTGLIHYTDMDRQPWLMAGNPNAGVWYTYLWRFVQSETGKQRLMDAIDRREVRPGLKAILELGPSVSAESTGSILADLGFVPPHRFTRIRSRTARRVLAPALRMWMALQFAKANGQLNVR